MVVLLLLVSFDFNRSQLLRNSLGQIVCHQAYQEWIKETVAKIYSRPAFFLICLLYFVVIVNFAIPALLYIPLAPLCNVNKLPHFVLTLTLLCNKIYLKLIYSKFVSQNIFVSGRLWKVKRPGTSHNKLDWIEPEKSKKACRAEKIFLFSGQPMTLIDI